MGTGNFLSNERSGTEHFLSFESSSPEHFRYTTTLEEKNGWWEGEQWIYDLVTEE